MNQKHQGSNQGIRSYDLHRSGEDLAVCKHGGVVASRCSLRIRCPHVTWTVRTRGLLLMESHTGGIEDLLVRGRSRTLQFQACASWASGDRCASVCEMHRPVAECGDVMCVPPQQHGAGACIKQPAVWLQPAHLLLGLILAALLPQRIVAHGTHHVAARRRLVAAGWVCRQAGGQWGAVRPSKLQRQPCAGLPLHAMDQHELDAMDQQGKRWTNHQPGPASHGRGQQQAARSPTMNRSNIRAQHAV